MFYNVKGNEILFLLFTVQQLFINRTQNKKTETSLKLIRTKKIGSADKNLHNFYSVSE